MSTHSERFVRPGHRGSGTRRGTRWITGLTWIAITGSPVMVRSAESPDLGVPITAADIAAISINVFPDGSGLPAGQGTVVAGQALYDTRCATCHGMNGGGGSAEELAGGDHGLLGDPPDKTIGTYWPYATTLFDYIRRAMPLDAPRSLSDDQVYALTAYLLYLNGVVGPTQTLDAPALAAITMPNRSGFIPVQDR